MDAVAESGNDVPEYLCQVTRMMQFSGVVQTTKRTATTRNNRMTDGLPRHGSLI